MKSERICITETPRDALQGWSRLIPATEKVNYINQLLKVGFDTVDVGSFVSPKAVPQMADTAEVISLLDTKESGSRIMVIAGNARGGDQACHTRAIEVIGYPYSISPSFLKKNLNTTPVAAWNTIIQIQEGCRDVGKQLQVYIAMAFGNPYHDHWEDELVLKEAESLCNLGIQRLAFSDITGEGTPESIGRLCSKLVNNFHGRELIIHLHSSPADWKPKVEAAWQAGFRNFESAIGGFGGCPLTGYDLLGNLDTLKLVDWCTEHGIASNLEMNELNSSHTMAEKIFLK